MMVMIICEIDGFQSHVQQEVGKGNEERKKIDEVLENEKRNVSLDGYIYIYIYDSFGKFA